jgi:hypothetical protein
LLVLEDLHWADTLSWDGCARVLGLVGRAPLLVAATYRPDVDDEGQQLIDEARRLAPAHVGESSLSELDETDADRLLASLLRTTEVGQMASALGLERAQGNPLFVEELVASAVEAGRLQPDAAGWILGSEADGWDPTAAVPETLQTLVLGRVDRVSPPERRLLFSASVLGPRFVVHELRAMLDEPNGLDDELDALSRRSLIRRDELAAEAVYSFKHALVRDTIYHSILRRNREPLHRAAALAIESSARELDVEAERLAYHWDSTSDDERAVAALVRAARVSYAAYRLQAALRHVERALLRGGDALAPDTRLQLEERRGDILALEGSHDEARSAYDAATSTVQPGSQARARLLRKAARTLMFEHDYDRASTVLGDGAAILDALDDRDQPWWDDRLQIVVDEMQLNYWRNNTERMAELEAQFADTITAKGSPRQQADFLTGQAMIAMRTTRYAIDDDTLDLVARIDALSRDDPDLAHRSFMVFNHGFCLLWRRDLEAARRRLGEALALAERGGDATTQARCRTYLAVVERFAEQPGACGEHSEAARELATATSMSEYVGAAEGNLAWIAWREGRVDDARERCDRAIAAWASIDLIYGFTWLARMPRLAILTADSDHEAAAEEAIAMTRPDHQRLTDPIADLLAAATTADPDALGALVEAARPLAYC